MADVEVEITSNNGEEEVEQRDIPHDLLTYQILMRLPLKLLVRFKCVSKLWYSTISSHRFTTTHFKLSPYSDPSYPTHLLFILSGRSSSLMFYNGDQEFEFAPAYSRLQSLRHGTDFDLSESEFRLVGSCNGLLCFTSLSGYFIIWNPVIRQWRKIAGPSCTLLNPFPPECKVSWGFGYATSVDDFKVVQIIELPYSREIVVHVFSLRRNQWRRVVDDELNRNPFSFDTPRGVLVGESLYWIATKTQDSTPKIVAFDLVLEKFEEFPHLDLTRSDVHDDKLLCVMGGCLSKCGINMYGDVFIETLANMSEFPKAKETINLLRDLDLSICKTLVGFTVNGKVFILFTTGQLAVIDPSSRPVEFAKLVALDRNDGIDIVNHVPSLISPLNIAQKE